jgi:hypothetical protein
MKRKLKQNSDGQQFHQYQQNEQSPLTLIHHLTTGITFTFIKTYFLVEDGDL